MEGIKIDKPNITWLIKKSSAESFQEEEDFYAGSLYDNSLEFNLEIWNNRNGTIQVLDLEDFSIEFTFDNLEDSALIPYFIFTINSIEIIPIQNGLTGVVKIPEDIVLSGEPNDGSASSNLNYIKVDVKLEIPKNLNIKINDLKTMTFKITNL